MKKIYAFLLAALVSLTLSGIPASAQCFVKITGIPAIGNLIRAKIATGQLQVLSWQLNGETVYNSYRRDFSSKGITVAGGMGYGSGSNQLAGPSDLFVDAVGNLYILDGYNNRVQKWAPGATSGITVAGGNGIGSAANQLFLPQGFFVDANGNIYIADLFNNRIQKWEPGAISGITVAGGNGYGSAANQFASPRDVFVDANGNVFISDADNNRIQKWTPGATTGITVAGGNGYGTGNNQFDGPQSIYLDPSGNLYVSDRANDRIQKWIPGSTTGVTAASGIEGGDSTSLNNPKGIQVNNDGIIYICDYFNNRIQKWIPGMNYGITSAGGRGAGKTAVKLFNPSGIFVTPSGDLYIADEGNNRVQKFAAASALNTFFIPSTPGTYRVIAVFANGCVDTSAEVIVPAFAATAGTNNTDITVTAIQSVFVYPNPAKTTAVVTFQATGNKQYQVQVTDMSGKLLQRSTIVTREGENKLTLNVSNLASGMYMINLGGNDKEKQSVKLYKE